MKHQRIAASMLMIGLAVAVGLGLFYTDFVSRGGLGLE